ncbi:hypothetical protein OG896_20780 [Streptomyces sp. NBC_00669]|uniref:hypothetical protein n=1 Tax=unclassified Streptomyces TaxID=2593676 RepID=UPI002E3380FF|nr:hypothetical protein [Streptomyces sp. NBC_00669]
MKRITKASVFGAVAVMASVVLGATPASASAMEVGCGTTGADGFVYASNWAPGVTKLNVEIELKDTLADGHHVQIRFMSKGPGLATTTLYQWHSVTSGNGTAGDWVSSATDPNGMYDMGVTVARFEGADQLNACSVWLLEGAA